MKQIQGAIRAIVFGATAAVVVAVCCAARAERPFVVVPPDDSTRVDVRTRSPIGRIELWAPEAIMSDRGACAIYPTGAKWREVEGGWEQSIGVRESYGPGNYVRTGNEIECVGVKYPVDEPVSWKTRLVPEAGRVTLEIRLRNEGARTIRRAGAAVCVKFAKGDWWSDNTTFAVSDRQLTTLAQLGRDAADDRFEAYRVGKEEFVSPFYEQFWGFNPRRIDRAILVSDHRAAGYRAVVESPRAYCMLSNRVNPCTDMMIAFGDIEPGAEATARGVVAIDTASAAEILLRQQAGEKE